MRHTVAFLVILPSLTAGAIGQQARTTSKPNDRIQKLIGQLGDKARWNDASLKLQAMGELAVKPLLAAIQSDDSIEDTPLTRGALKTLGNMGPTAKEAYAVLFESVGQCEPKIYLTLLHTLADLVPYSEDKGNQATVQVLVQASMGAIQAMDRDDRRLWSSEYQRFAARVKVDAEAGLEAMIKELEMNQPYRREVAAEVLGRMGRRAKTAIPALANALRGQRVTRRTGRVVRRVTNRVSRNDNFRRKAAEAMITIAPGDARCAVAYGHRIQHSGSENERAEAALRIGAFGKAAKSEIPTLIAALKDKSQRVRCETITALGMFGPAANAAVARLEQLAKSDEKAIAVRAQAALKQITGR